MNIHKTDSEKLIFSLDDTTVLLSDIESVDLSSPCHVIDFSFSIQSLKEVFACLHFNHSFLILDSKWPSSFKKRHIDLVKTYDFNDPVFFIVTSGSTGLPKLVCHHLDSLFVSVQRSFLRQPISSDEKILLSLPAFSMGGLLTIAKSFLSNAILHASSDHWSTLISSDSKFHCAFVPQQLPTLLNLPSFNPLSFSSILIGGDVLPNQTKIKILGFHLPVIYSYGLTETCGQVIASDIGKFDVFDVLDDVEILYEDQQLMVETSTIALGYLTPNGLIPLPKKNGFFLTNDIVTPLPHFKLIGRKDFQFQSGAKLVSPEFVESELLKSNITDRIIIIPKPDRKFTNVPIAFISKNSDISALMRYSDEHLPKFMRPHQYIPLPDELSFEDNLCRMKLLKMPF